MTKDTNNEAASARASDDQINEAVRAYVQAGKNGCDLYNAMRAAVEAAAATASQSSTAGAAKGGDTCKECDGVGTFLGDDDGFSDDSCNTCGGTGRAPAVPEGVDTAELPTGSPEDAWHEYATRSGLLNECGVAPEPAKTQTAYFAYQAAWNHLHSAFTTYGAQQREAGRREGIRHASKRISEEMAATRQTVSGMTDVQAWRIYEAAVEAVGRADTSREYAIKLVRAVESSLSATPPNKGSEDDKLFADNYRWLRDRGNSLETRQYDKGIANGPSCYHMVEGIRELKHGEELDAAIKAAIDTARAVPPAQGGQS